MMEAAYSLMQLAKTSAKLAQLAEEKIPYISICTDPTFGGATGQILANNNGTAAVLPDTYSSTSTTLNDDLDSLA